MEDCYRRPESSRVRKWRRGGDKRVEGRQVEGRRVQGGGWRGDEGNGRIKRRRVEGVEVEGEECRVGVLCCEQPWALGTSQMGRSRRGASGT